MKNHLFTGPLSALFIVVTMVVSSCTTQEKNEMKPPKAKKIPHEMTMHGQTRTDNYYWLNQREDSSVIAYLKAENTYADSILNHTKALQEKLYDEMIGRINQTDISVPYLLNGYFYYTRFEEGEEYPIYCRKKESMDGVEEIMLNGNEMAEDYAFFQIGGLEVSSNNNLLAFSVDTVSRRQYTIYIKNLSTGEIYADAILNTSGNMAWANDDKTLYYSIKDETLRPYKILKHVLGSDIASDIEVYQENDPTFYSFVYKTKSRDYVVIGSTSTMSAEFRYQKADNPSSPFLLFQSRQSDLLYSIDHYADHFYVRTNLDAKNFRLMKTPVDKTEMSHWTEVISHRDDVLLEDFDVFANFLAVSERKDGLVQLRIMKWDNSTDYYIDFGEPAYTAYLSTNLDFNTNKVRYGYTSLTTPNSVFEFDMLGREKKLLKQQEVLGGYNPEDYKTERLYATSHDGVKVPISLVYKKGLVKNGDNPTLLYGYGSYGVTMDAYFSSSRLSLLDRGFVFAIAHIRGGQELGRQWYEDGKLLKKKNTFYDFIACGEYMIEQKFTSKSKLFAMGGSAGGLLVGAVINMRPDLWRGVVAQVPFVDVVTTMLDETIPLTTGEYDEWGNPNEKESYEFMLSYSPYDQVEAIEYPAMLVTTGLHDSQVQYWEPAKWVAKLRDMKKDNNALLLKTNMDFGHGGASGRFERLREAALEYAFMLNELGIEE
ncbi:MAG: oligopeptidase B [Bacteroidetes bacterium HGW-Bacteroidetes-1]|jgi:oligopeptidase B|nr:MAG: oligopeptidase B [Bacteroidetes bacterium HGW-Bacteroidetes-1]